MSIVITLNTELEELLRAKAEQEGQDIDAFASELLANALTWETVDSEEAVKGIQQGLDDFKAGKYRSFKDFAEEQRQKLNLSDS